MRNRDFFSRWRCGVAPVNDVRVRSKRGKAGTVSEYCVWNEVGLEDLRLNSAVIVVMPCFGSACLCPECSVLERV